MPTKTTIMLLNRLIEWVTPDHYIPDPDATEMMIPLCVIDINLLRPSPFPDEPWPDPIITVIQRGLPKESLTSATYEIYKEYYPEPDPIESIVKKANKKK